MDNNIVNKMIMIYTSQIKLKLETERECGILLTTFNNINKLSTLHT